MPRPLLSKLKHVRRDATDTTNRRELPGYCPAPLNASIASRQDPNSISLIMLSHSQPEALVDALGRSGSLGLLQNSAILLP